MSNFTIAQLFIRKNENVDNSIDTYDVVFLFLFFLSWGSFLVLNPHKKNPYMTSNQILSIIN